MTQFIYEFTSVDDFVKHLDIRAKQMREQQKRLHNRTHENAALGRGASEIESIAAMVRTSNLVAVKPHEFKLLNRGDA